MGSEAWELERRYSVPGALDTRGLDGPPNSEDLHAWSIYRQNLNSDFTDSALGSAEKSPLPYGNFQLRDSTVQSILRHPRYGPKSPLANHSHTYLKFGLPRVLPPSVLRARDAGSSGYDSSEEGRIRAGGPNHISSYANHQTSIHLNNHQQYQPNGVGLPNGNHFSQHQQQIHLNHNHHQNHTPSGRAPAFGCVQPAMRSARSDPDFRNAISAQQGRDFHGSNIGTPHHVGNARSMCRDAAAARARSASEANLLHSSTITRSPRPSQITMSNRRHSIAPIDPGIIYERRMSLGPAANSMLGGQSMSHPHLQLRELESRSSNAGVSRNVSFEAGAGDLLAVMSTSEKEGTLIIETISGKRRITRGDVLLNGRAVTQKTLRTCVAHLPSDAPIVGLSPNLTAIQYLSFYKLLRGAPGISNEEVDTILQELGLDATKHCLISSLTCSESRRLALACRLLQGTQILTLDKPTRGLDIFDAFFLVDYLRQWALRGQRLVVLTLHPPTYEILTMLSRVTLTSGGRLMYSGTRRDMLPYFAMAEFPCPPFKNPSDYYLDLVTLDDLSAEAMLESSQRIDHLAELARSRLQPLTEPGAPGPLPTFNYGANPFVQFYAIVLRNLYYSQPWSLANLLQKILLAASLGVLLGSVFWDVANEQMLQLKDRVGFHYASLGVMFWPLSLLGIVDVMRGRPHVEKDIEDGLYSRFVYSAVELISGVLTWGLIYLSYLGPAFTMTGLHLTSANPTSSQGDDNLDNLWHFLGLGLLYLMFQHYVCILFSRICKYPFLAILLSGITVSEMTLASGFTLHVDNMPSWYRLVSPLRWVFSLLLPRVHTPAALAKFRNCTSEIQRQLIITQPTCEQPDGERAMRELSFLNTDPVDVVYRTWLFIATGVLMGLVFLTFLIVRYREAKKSLRSVPNKP